MFCLLSLFVWLFYKGAGLLSQTLVQYIALFVHKELSINVSIGDNSNIYCSMQVYGTDPNLIRKKATKYAHVQG